MKLLGVHIDDKLNFNEHIKICKSVGNQLNALIRVKSFLGLKEFLVNIFIYSNFNYCPLECSHIKIARLN